MSKARPWLDRKPRRWGLMQLPTEEMRKAGILGYHDVLPDDAPYPELDKTTEEMWAELAPQLEEALRMDDAIREWVRWGVLAE